MAVVKRISGRRVRVGGTQHTGWLPGGASEPLPAPVRELLFDLEIQFDGYGYLLCSESRGGELYADSWHQTLEGALGQAEADFGVPADLWLDAG